MARTAKPKTSKISKITTKDCVEHIIRHTGEAKPWKRACKYRAANPSGNETFDILEGPPDDYVMYVDLREFVLKEEPGKIAFVWATPTKIVKVAVVVEETDSKKLSAWYKKYKDGENIRGIIESVNVIQCESVVPSIRDVPMIMEAADFENMIVGKRFENVIHLTYGGDWQPPSDADFRIMTNGKLYLDHTTVEIAKGM